MKRLGVAAVFQPGTSLESIITFIRDNRRSRELA
jgi:methylmalonyl-CoA mutase cobalamin-binding subunit